MNEQIDPATRKMISSRFKSFDSLENEIEPYESRNEDPLRQLLSDNINLVAGEMLRKKVIHDFDPSTSAFADEENID